MSSKEISDFFYRLETGGRFANENPEQEGNSLLKPFYDLPVLKNKLLNKFERIIEIIKE